MTTRTPQDYALEPVAVIGDDFALHWIGSDPISQIVERHDLRTGSLLYAAPQSGWISVDERLPPCTNDQDYIGINSAGFAGIFNAIADIAGNVYCMMETAEDSISIMSDLSIWKPFKRPLPTAPSTKGEPT